MTENATDAEIRMKSYAALDADFKAGKSTSTQFADAVSRVLSGRSDGVSEALRQNYLDTTEPYRLRLKKSEERMAQMSTVSLADAKKQFITRCKGGNMDPARVMMGFYVYYASCEADRLIFSSLLLSSQSLPDLVEQYNWRIARLHDAAFLPTWGEVIAVLKYPLFPFDPELYNSTIDILQEAKAAMALVAGGGAPSSSWVPTAYKKVIRSSLIGGEFLLPVQQTAIGLAVDVQPAVDAHHSNVHHIQQLQAQLQALQGPQRKGNVPHSSRRARNGQGNDRGNGRSSYDRDQGQYGPQSQNNRQRGSYNNRGGPQSYPPAYPAGGETAPSQYYADQGGPQPPARF